jgi:hypothetical protein
MALSDFTGARSATIGRTIRRQRAGEPPCLRGGEREGRRVFAFRRREFLSHVPLRCESLARSNSRLAGKSKTPDAGFA